ncbi:UDP-N-acetyl-alpha-D-muramoyl-L-alanyl-L-glutamate epimerase [soil metagenome]
MFMTRIDPSILRDKHPRFFYKKVELSFANETLQITFTFHLENGPVFKPTLSFPKVSAEHFSSLDQNLIQEWAFQIGLVEMLSYWKTAATPEIIIEAGYLSEAQKPFWLNLLHKGLSEYFFVNKIDGWAEGFVKLMINHEQVKHAFEVASVAESVLLPVGGGKDSVVSLELAKKLAIPVKTFTLNLNKQVESVLETSGFTQNIEVIRKIDPQLSELNGAGYLNGHTPFSALLGFISTLAALLHGIKYVALSNEWSANEGNTSFLGQTINHQYSKTFEFELLFKEYLDTYLTPEIVYFSWLRPLHELQIAKKFSNHPAYFSTFLSCNRGQKTGRWCGECPKCLFVYILLSAFLNQVEVNKIWGEDLLSKESLLPILNELTGEVEVKSLECVGTRQESIFALALALQRNPDKKQSGLWKVAEEIVGDVDQVAADSREFLRGYENESLLPEEFRVILRN